MDIFHKGNAQGADGQQVPEQVEGKPGVVDKNVNPRLFQGGAELVETGLPGLRRQFECVREHIADDALGEGIVRRIRREIRKQHTRYPAAVHMAASREITCSAPPVWAR